MADIMETTPEMDLDIELINGLDNHDDRHPTPVNEQPLPVDDSRPGTPHLTNCEQRENTRQKYEVLHHHHREYQGQYKRSLKLHGLTDEDCHIMKEHVQRLDNYTTQRANAWLELVDSSSRSQSLLAEDCDRSGTATSVDGTPCTEDEPNSLFDRPEISSAVSAC
ncbi:hypothetical protein TNCV_1334681 [Trichonephila clavipes]|nr:hypothetical protein TNCV_1334681 [Trichonephila clavipes]